MSDVRLSWRSLDDSSLTIDGVDVPASAVWVRLEAGEVPRVWVELDAIPLDLVAVDADVEPIANGFLVHLTEARGPATSPDCFARKHGACSGDGGIDERGALIPCDCECHR